MSFQWVGFERGFLLDFYCDIIFLQREINFIIHGSVLNLSLTTPFNSATLYWFSHNSPNWIKNSNSLGSFWLGLIISNIYFSFYPLLFCFSAYSWIFITIWYRLKELFFFVYPGKDLFALSTQQNLSNVANVLIIISIILIWGFLYTLRTKT